MVPDVAYVPAMDTEKVDLIVQEDIVSPTESTLSTSTSEQFSAAESKAGSTRISRLRSLISRHIQERSEPVWRPSMSSVRPLAGLLALILSISCMFVSLAILLASHEQPVRRWPIQPPVYLAIASAIANVALACARYLAVPIAWWYTASRGNSIRDLERQWEVSQSVALALRHNVRMGFAGFTTIVVALMIIDG
ncbi:hypothetical protein LTR22_013389 [Elasticomyces elasticus]|nr:hypothetical protein LTR22_013389 [Elasticomyces elasticus]KAK4916806.1 hypothetical protein LTR49_015250 [Elasticomyces elasticus]KAK5755956.1 hypothetical protein LTS12_013960 [Elasticomyces elasticus]